MKNLQLLLVLSALCLLPYSVRSASAELFLRSLRIGDTGADVLRLQQLLNRDPASSIAASGPGSRGQETTYFGQKTAQAVIRFQEKYTYEVLWPANLKKGTGVVGPLTRAKLNQLMAAATAEPSTPIPPVTAPPLSAPTALTSSIGAAPTISSISPARGGPGTIVTITGSGFDAISNTIYTGYGEFIRGAISPEVIQIEIQPNFPRFMNGPVEFPFWIYIKNKNGSSNAKTFTFIAP